MEEALGEVVTGSGEHSCVTSALVELTATPTLCLTSALTAVFCRRVDSANSVMETS